MQELKLETGLVTYSLNGACEVSFNPTDVVFVERLFDAFDYLGKKQDAYKAEIAKTADEKQVFEIARRRDKEMRELIDGLFGVPVCDAVFGSTSVYALADGLPVWCNLMLAIIDEVDTTFAREQKANNTRITKYTAKYHA